MSDVSETIDPATASPSPSASGASAATAGTIAARPIGAARSFGAFLRAFLRRPARLGTVVPSSRRIERALVDAVFDDSSPSTIVELGPGTGGTTRALLAAMPPQSRLIAVEIDALLVAELQLLDDARLTVLQADATRLDEVLDRAGVRTVDAIVCGIPISALPAREGVALVRTIAASLAPGGRFVGYQMHGRLGRLAGRVFGPPARSRWVLGNVPPLRVQRWDRDAVGGEGGRFVRATDDREGRAEVARAAEPEAGVDRSADRPSREPKIELGGPSHAEERETRARELDTVTS